MSNPEPVPVIRRQVEVKNALGLHLRPAEKFVKLAQSFTAEIFVHHQGKRSNGKSMLDLMTLAALQGATLEIEATGPDAPAAVAALAGLVDARFHETDDGEEAPPP